MPEITDLIKKRVSCRTYTDKPLEAEVLREFSELVAAEHTGPFGNKARFQLINLNVSSPGERKKLGTYGVIKNARMFLVGTIKKKGSELHSQGYRDSKEEATQADSNIRQGTNDDANRGSPLKAIRDEMALEDYGYCKEILILHATALGLGTCWLAGTFNAGGFAAAVNRKEGEIIPTVSPVGYPAGQRSITEKIMRRVAGSDNRKPWQEIFFAGNFSTPLTRKQAGIYAEALENVRLAPSASNKQPWRVLRVAADNSYHFYLSRVFGYTFRDVPIQDIDMGIAMSHFALTARQLGRSGSWIINTDHPQEASLDYIATWQENI